MSQELKQRFIKLLLLKKIVFLASGLFILLAVQLLTITPVYAADTINTAVYLDTDDDGDVDVIRWTMDENVTACTYEAGDWTVNTASDFNISVTGLTCTTSDAILDINVSADANETGSGTDPQISYANQGTADSVMLASGMTAKSNVDATDSAKPVLSAVALSSAGNRNRVTFTYTENVTVTNGASTTTSFDTTTAGQVQGVGNFATTGNVTVATTKNTVGGSGGTAITLDLADQAAAYMATASTTEPSGVFTPIATTSVIDANSNQVNTSATAPTTTGSTSWDLTKPTISSITVNDAAGSNNGRIDQAVIVFSEAVRDANIINADADLGTAGTTTGTFTTGTANDATTTFDRTDDNDVDTSTSAGDFTYDTTYITDRAGNLLDTATDGQIASGDNTETDGADPIIITSSLLYYDNGNNGSTDRIEMEFSEVVTWNFGEPNQFAISNQNLTNFDANGEPDSFTGDNTDTFIFTTSGTTNLTGVSGGTEPTIDHAGSGTPANCVQDATGNELVNMNPTSIDDEAEPVLLSFTSTEADATYGPADTINVTATYTENITGSVSVVLDTTGTVTLSTASTNTLYDDYTVGATGSGQNSSDLTVSSISSQNATDGSNANTTTTMPSTNIADGSAIVVDTTAPFGYSVTFDQPRYNASQQTAVSFTFAGAEVGAGYNYSIDDTNGATAAITGSGTIATATDNISGIDVSSLNDDTLTLTVYLTDTAGNQGGNAQHTTIKDTVDPTLVSFTSTTGDGTYGPTANINITATYDETLNGGGTINVVLDNGVTVSLSTPGGSATAVGTYTVGATGSSQDTLDITVASISAENIPDLAGNTQTGSSVPGAPNNIADTSAIVIDTTAPTFSSAVANSDTNILITMNEPVGSVTFGAAADWTATGITSLGVAINAGNIDLTVVSLGNTAFTAADFAFAVANGGDIQDAAGNVTAAFGPVGITDGQAPLFASSVVDDTNSDGTIDQATITYSETVTIADGNAGDAFPGISFNNGCSAVNADYASGGTTTSVVALTGCAAGANTPTVTYTTAGSINDLVPIEMPNGESILSTDGAAPAPISATFYDADENGTLDLITVVWSETLTPVASGTADDDWILTSAADFAGIVEGVIECNSGAAGATECDYNFTTTTEKTDVGDLSLAYNGTSVTDGTNAADPVTFTSASSPAFTDGAAPVVKSTTITLYDVAGGDAIVDRLIATYTESLADNADAAGDWAVTTNSHDSGGACPVTVADPDGTDSLTIDMTCDTPYGDVGDMSVVFTNSGNTLEDAAGNDVPNKIYASASTPPIVNGIVPGVLTSTDVQPASLNMGTSGTATVSFTTIKPIGIDGKIKVTFGAGYDVTGAAGGICSTMDGTFVTTVAGQEVTITRQSDGTSEPAGAQTCTIDTVVNPATAGTTGTYDITTTYADDVVIDQDSAVTADTIVDPNPPNGGGGSAGGSRRTTSPAEDESEADVAFFGDIVDHWAEDYINEIAELEIVTGRSEGIFAPNDEITRAELTKIAVNAFGLTVPEADSITEKSFIDVEITDWYAPYIQVAKETNIVEGYGDEFRPDVSINRAEALKIMLEASNLDIGGEYSASFEDIVVTAWYMQYIAYASNNDIVIGYNDGTFGPEKNMSRAEVAKVIVKIMEML